ncbi:MAG TPA: peptidoglycan DD-metalloendopeptidase family protein [Caulobacteraceae bacterium]|jgi:septal ring factor EnvC (AmiA/AmiB activator)
MFSRAAIGAAITLLAATAAAQDARAPSTLQLRGELAARREEGEADRAQAEAARRDIARLREELEALKALSVAPRGGGVRQARLEAVARREAELNAEMAKSQGELARLLGALQLYTREPPPALLASPQSAKDAVRAAILIRAMQPEITRRARAAALRAERIRVLRRAAAAANEDLFTSESAIADRKAELEQLIGGVGQAERRFDARAQLSERQAGELTRRLTAAGAPLDPPPGRDRGPAVMLAPVSGELTGRYGGRSAGGQRSEGFTWRAAPGAQVRAPAAGVLEYAGDVKGWGGVLILRLGGGYHAVLAGVEDVFPSVGGAVKAGQALGRMAASKAGGRELYLEVRKDGAPVDPARWLRPSALAQASGSAG